MKYTYTKDTLKWSDLAKKELWEDVTIEMMSDEDRRGDVYVRLAPSYCSAALTKFILKLDNRCDKMSFHPRVRRQVGSPAKIQTPSNAKKWTIKKVSEQVEDSSATTSTPTTLPTTPLQYDDSDTGNDTVDEGNIEGTQDSEFDVSSDSDH